MRPPGSGKFFEERRRRVIRFLRQNLFLHEIARRIGCHASSVMRWRTALQSGGQDALKAKPASGRPPRLTLKQKKTSRSPFVPRGHGPRISNRVVVCRVLSVSLQRGAEAKPPIGTGVGVGFRPVPIGLSRIRNGLVVIPGGANASDPRAAPKSASEESAGNGRGSLG